MSDDSIEKAALTKAALALFDEAFFEAPDPHATWFTDNEPKCGFLGSVEALSAADASRPLYPGESLTIASHVGHLRFALDLANRAARGENPYKDARWARSWDRRAVNEAEWKTLVADLRAECASFRAFLASGGAWKDEDFMTGSLGLIAHGAWHLGAIRQGLGLIKAPKAQ
jgi:hypothetical protein